MSRFSSPGLAIAGPVVIGLATAAAMTITPASHDYGDIAVSAVSINSPFDITLLPGAAPGSKLTVTVAGADAGDFRLRSASTIHVDSSNSGCANTPQRSVCSAKVEFRPRSLGPKLARLVVTDNHGNRAIAQLTGKGISAVCLHRVVPCNYSHFFSGVFSWKIGLNGPKSTYSENVEVIITNGVAVCNGAATQREHGQSLTGAITGTGLIAVEFEADPIHTWVYKITAACPTPAWPATQDSEATPSQPAELGHNEQNSEKQPAGGVGLTLQQAIAQLARLQGSITYPSPDTDPLNGVSGSVTVSWSLLWS